MAIRFAQSAPKPAPRIVKAKVEPAKNKGGRPKLGRPKAVLNIRVDADVLERWRATGPGWQKRMNAVLASAKL